MSAGQSVLDIGCGAGELSLALARSQSAAKIIGVDVSAPLIEVAQERGKGLANLEYYCGDAAVFSQDVFSPDTLISRHGVMFFDDPGTAFSQLSSLSAHNARLIFSCFRPVTENEWAIELLNLLGQDVGAAPQAYRPGPFGFADNDWVSNMLRNSGWCDVHCEAFDFTYIAGAGADPLSDAIDYFLSIGPAAAAAARLDTEEKAVFRQKLSHLLQGYLVDDVVSLGAAAWIVSARKQDES